MRVEYTCHICGGLCDAGELENGVCHACRTEAVHKQETRSLQTRKELVMMMRSRYAEQSDGQLVLSYGS